MNSIDTPAKRTRLAARKNPYWQGVSGGRGGVSLGYRRGFKGNGVWIAKIALDGSRCEERIGVADDNGAAPGAISFPSAVAAALIWGRQQCEVIDAGKAAEGLARIPTVRSSVGLYIEMRQRRSTTTGLNAKSRLTRHVLSNQKFSDTKLSRLRSSDFEGWRGRLPESLSQATVNRLLNDLRAALNLSIEKHRRELPAATALEVKFGTKAGDVSTNARRQLLTDAQVRAAVHAAFEVDPDFGQVVLVAAATGGRYSQIAKLKVQDVQVRQSRIMLPSSKKGRGRKTKSAIAVPVNQETIRLLAPSIKGRPQDEPLLRRWGYRRAGGLKWERTNLRELGPAYEVEKQWAETVTLARLPTGTVMYALRHTSIVRGLIAGLPVRLIAALHDTSVVMIEQHYSAFITDMSDELVRPHVITFTTMPLAQAAE